jgi:hypothetical protein
MYQMGMFADNIYLRLLLNMTDVLYRRRLVLKRYCCAIRRSRLTIHTGYVARSTHAVQLDLPDE